MGSHRLIAAAGFALALTFSLYAASMLLRAPCLGVADNMDYWRVMSPAGISHVQPVDPPGQYVACRYQTGNSNLRGLFSTPALLAWVARHLNWNQREVGPDGMDLRQMGLVYFLITLSAILAAGAGKRVSTLLTAGFLYVLVDPGYLLFFNSFYADSALFVSLFGAALWFVVRASPGRVGTTRLNVFGAAGLVVFAALGGGAKMQFVVFPGVLLASVALLLFLQPTCRCRAWFSLSAVLFAVTLVAPWHYFNGPAPRFLEVNNYHAVYAGLIEASSDPNRVFEEIGIVQEYRTLPRRDVWSGNVPMGHPVFAQLRNLSRWQLLRLYLSDGSAVLATARRIEDVFASPTMHVRGNFPRAAGRIQPGAQYAVAWQFSHVRGWLFERWPKALWLVLAATMVWLTASAATRRWNGVESAALLLLGFALVQFVVAVLGDGFVSLEQHLIAARLSVDFLLVLVLHQAVSAAAGPFTPSTFTRNA